MKLGIVVVYLVSEENEKLLDLHLSQIEKHTQVPYTIYGIASRLLPKFRRRLEQHPKIKICECPTTDLRDSEEHAFYLDQLIEIALEDGVSHIAILHVDSFPVRSGWAEELAGKLSASCVLAGVMRDEKYDRKPLTACILFHRDFYLKYHPAFLLSEADLSSPTYKQYCRDFGHVPDSGVGYGFKIYSEGLSWHPLLRSNKGEDHYLIGSIYGDLIFHLGAAARDKTFTLDKHFTTTGTLRRPVSALLPQRVKDMIRKIIPDGILFPEMHAGRKVFERVREQLFEDSESYLNYLRTGKR